MQVNKRIAITSAVLGGITLLLLGALVVPTVLAMKEAKAKIAEARHEIETRYALRRETRESVSQLEDVKKRLAEMPPVAIREGQELDFINALEVAAASSGVEQELALETVNQKQLSPWETDIPVRLQATGEYRKVMAYLRRVEKMSYYVRTSSLSISIPQAREAAAEGTVYIRIDGYIRWLAKDLPMFQKLNITPEPPKP
ncbi:MAG: hypothetical protein PHT12_01925 [Patescibacteria group bacterium]|nr:hypothetical protein [Patescibacteria group bacterium]